MTNADLVHRDLQAIWHPCTQMKDHETLPLIPIQSGKGVYLYDFDGNRYLDIVSSWWVNIFGHANPIINAAIKEQLDTLEHVLLAGCGHEPAVTLAEKLISITPGSLTRCFFADNGSSAIEAAIKMAFHYFKNSNRIRPKILSLSNSYHGETIGALSIGDVSLYKKTYAELLIHTAQAPVPQDTSEESALEAIARLREILEKEGESICAFIVEPLIQCAGQMHMYHPLYLTEAYKLCQEYDILFIADEIAAGFGRTGTMFACEQAGITPDMLILSKGLSGGYLPISVVLTTDAVYQRFYADYNEHRAFLHSHSYSGNPLACAAANATLSIFDAESTIETNAAKSKQMSERINQLGSHPKVSDIRQHGMVAALDLQGYTPEQRIGIQIYQQALKKGLLLRPLANTLYFMPPYVITPEEIDGVFDTVTELLEGI